MGITYSIDGINYTNISGIFPGLTANTNYNVTSKDGTGCVSNVFIAGVNPTPTPPTAPALSQVNPTCTVTTGAITLTAVAGLNYQLDAGPFGPYPAGGYTGLVAGSTHTVTAQNAGGCTATSAPVTIGPVLTVPTAPALTQVDPTCTVTTGAITLTAVAGLNYQLDEGPFGPYPAGGYTGLVAGSTHTVTAQNAGGCTATLLRNHRTGTDRSNRSGNLPRWIRHVPLPQELSLIPLPQWQDSTISLTRVRSALTRLAVTQDLSQVQRIPLLHKNAGGCVPQLLLP